MNEALRRRVAERARGCCEYCLYPAEVSLIPHQIDHVIPRQHGGDNTEDNLAFCCAACNRVKGPNLASLDPDTQQITPLYNPRTQRWAEHFQLEDAVILGVSPQGRATVALLRLNGDKRLRERRALIARGKFSSEAEQ